MFIAFNFKEISKFTSSLSYSVNKTVYRARGREIYQEDEKQFEDTIEKYYLENNQNLLDGNKIMEEWFPLVESEIFISHSHSDIEQIYELVGFLSIEFGIKAFIDSAVWGYADKLLKMIDDKHCKNEGSNTYNYNKRNVTTSNVYLMLLNSLQNMIDNTECLFFVQTPNSIKKINEQFDDSTYSPWIFSELNIVDKIRIKKPVRRYKFRVSMNFEKRAETDQVLLEKSQVVYKIDEQLSKLENLSFEDLINWKKIKSKPIDSQRNLDNLYFLKGIFDNE